MSHLFLISVDQAYPAIKRYIELHPDDDAPIRPQEMREMTEMVRRYARLSRVLMAYAVVLAGKPSRN